MRIGAMCAGLVFSSVLLFADDHSVNFDSHTDFSKFKTFTISDSKITSARAELNNSIVVSKVHDAIRSELVAKGLKETSVHPDVIVSFSISEQAYNIGPFGRASAIDESRGGRGRGQREGGDPLAERVDFTEGTLVLDFNSGQPQALIWRGVYRDSEKNATKLAQKMPNDAKKLLAEYPSGHKK